jgi:CPA2 family monovalent cation:H+ antiporter-2
MLFNPMVLVTHPLPVLAVLFIILVGKTVVGYLLIVLFRRPIGTALTVSAGLAQIGEFSFILATLGITLGILPEEGRDLILAGAIISIIVNPALFWLAEVLRPRLEARFPGHAHAEAATGAQVEPEIVAPSAEPVPVPVPPEEEDEHATALDGHTILAGYGRVGTVIGEGLLAAGIPFVLIEDAEGRVAAARRAGIEVIEGNAATSRALALANVEGATTIIIAIPNAFEAGQAVEGARRLNAKLLIIARAHSDEEAEYLRGLGADHVVMGEREIGRGMAELAK